MLFAPELAPLDPATSPYGLATPAHLALLRKFGLGFLPTGQMVHPHPDSIPAWLLEECPGLRDPVALSKSMPKVDLEALAPVAAPGPDAPPLASLTLELGSPFTFDVFGGRHGENQARYEQIGDVVALHVEWLLMLPPFGLTLGTVPLPGKVPVSAFLDASPRELELLRSRIYFSPNYATCERLVVLIQGKGAVRPGQWARSLIMNDNMEAGAIFPYLREIFARGLGVIVLNPNNNHVEFPGAKRLPIPGSENAIAHTLYVWENFIRPAACSSIDFVVHSFGGVCAVELLAKIEHRRDFKRINQVLFTDSFHDDDVLPRSTRVWLSKNSVNFAASTLPAGTKIGRPSEGALQVSAGHPRHEYSSCKAMSMVMACLMDKAQFRQQFERR
ncbi:hypothetical protein H696_01186 [Fonticula alba]|uniref:Arb2 domain-containing protein n=1 Tax=Fonticula alba TaxID=691883 RepID=A0A058ZCW0_FONAL|nr:hypothetical protein H696_01186 [Fonticula alba]KCV71768.1 hypothetical protein H696_01186 [Fonticula alba]|eukprot:XP_009493346.1 hypothetical protein H696_01186 [Fonticula alba]